MDYEEKLLRTLRRAEIEALRMFGSEVKLTLIVHGGPVRFGVATTERQPGQVLAVIRQVTEDVKNWASVESPALLPRQGSPEDN